MEFVEPETVPSVRGTVSGEAGFAFFFKSTEECPVRVIESANSPALQPERDGGELGITPKLGQLFLLCVDADCLVCLAVRADPMFERAVVELALLFKYADESSVLLLRGQQPILET